jgi:small neutral amino acid transporter SnatA (MarC family)
MDLLTRVSGIILVSLSMQFLVSGLTELFATTEFAKHFIHGS